MAKINLYSKEEVDKRIESASANTYNKSEIDSIVNDIVNNVYTKSDVNIILNRRLNGVTRRNCHTIRGFEDFKNYAYTNTLKPGDTVAITIQQNNRFAVVKFDVEEYNIIDESNIFIQGIGFSYHVDESTDDLTEQILPTIGVVLDKNRPNVLVVYDMLYLKDIGITTFANDYIPTSVDVFIVTTEEV